jgi:hypothetical protein
MPTKYIFVTGGVMSGVGKGVAAASICKLLKSKGFETTAIKIDPYVNVDAGTMNPTEHGEVFVLDDGMECDQDMGNYERFLIPPFCGKLYDNRKRLSFGYKQGKGDGIPRQMRGSGATNSFGGHKQNR